MFAHGVSLILQAILTSGGGMLFGIFDGHGGAACGQASPQNKYHVVEQ
jgi:serine/threonine protein phosphatase PrpC